MSRQKIIQILMGFAIAASTGIALRLLFRIFNHGTEWEQLELHLRSLAVMAQVLKTSEFRDLMDFLHLTHESGLYISTPFLWLLTLFICSVGLACSWFLLAESQKFRQRTHRKVPEILPSEIKGDPIYRLDQNLKVPENENYKMFSKALDDLKSATEALARIVGKGSLADIQGDLECYEAQYNKIVHVAAFGNLICNEIQGVHKALLKTSKRLQRLAYQCRDSANFSATTQLDWKRNIMINNLRQVKEGQDKIHDTASHIRSVHQSASRLLQEIFGIELVFHDRYKTISGYLGQVQEEAKAGFQDINLMVTRIAEAKEQSGQAGNLVSGLTQKAEAIVNLIQMIDDLADQINLQALNASIEAAKMGHHGYQFAEIAERLCKLTSRSSVASQSVSELLTTIQEETGRASGQLNGACEAMEDAFTSVSDCGNSYRKAVAATKYALSEMSLLDNEFSIHVNKLREVEKLGKTSSVFFDKLSSLLEADDKLSGRINDETSRLTAYSDKLSQLLSKQFHELNHCEKMLLDTTHLVLELEKQATENKHSTMSLKVALEQLNTKEGPISLDEFSQRVANRHLTLLKSSSETLEHFRLPGQTASMT
ncbi:MAG: hypothetical protein H6618_05170 [Deltaproteobacteria bacterium]|nr:hypothetical protein [Deltaproteobacteria bacterium]